MNQIFISPSLLAANPMDMHSEVKKCERAGADMLHIDVMDGHFVPNLTFGLPFIKALKKITDLPLDVHLMISNPDQAFDEYLKAGADMLTFHIEASTHPHRVIEAIRRHGSKAGIALNPHTPISHVDELLPYLDIVLIMSVNPGFGGQSFIETATDKTAKLKDRVDSKNLSDQITIAIDGGINANNIQKCHQAGIQQFVAGSSLFNSPCLKEAITQLRSF